MNAREQLNKLTLPDQGDRTAAIIEREGGSRLSDQVTVKCCNMEFTGPSEIALGLAAEHRRKAHPGVKRKTYPSLAARSAAARASGSKASRGETE